jgi:adenylate cyclase
MMNVGVALSVVFVASAWFVRSLEIEKAQLKDLTDFLKKTFGRFHSDQVLDAIIEDPTAAQATGARQAVTIMMSDLRGFTALCERRTAEEVVEMLNVYLAAMVDVIYAYRGTINDISGDGMLIVFGAPKPMDDRVDRAVACAIRMQTEMASVNDILERRSLPALQMGIGIHDTEVIVGTIGSAKRAKYDVVGSGVNMASRIETYATAGQVLVEQSVVDAIGDTLRIDGRREILPKGSESLLIVYDVGGISGQHHLSLDRPDDALIELSDPIAARAAFMHGKVADDGRHDVSILMLSRTGAQLRSASPMDSNLTVKLSLRNVPGLLGQSSAYANVTHRNGNTYRITFTSVAPEIDAYFLAHLRLASQTVQDRA